MKKKKSEGEAGPVKPAHLTAGAGAEWDAMIPKLREAGLLATVDPSTLAEYCQAYGRWVEAETAIKTTGTIVRSKSGNPVPSPYLAVADKASERMKKLSRLIWNRPAEKGGDEKKEPRLVTRAQAAAELGVKPTRINKWAADGAPVAVRGSRGHSAYYDVEALKQWIADRGRPDQDDSLSLGVARARLATAQAEKYERENRVREGELLERSQVVAEGQTVLGSLKAKILAISRLAVMRGIVAREKEQELHSLHVDALRELARWDVGEKAPAAGDPDSSDEAEE